MAAYDPFIGINPVVSAMEQRRGYVEQLRQNTSRLAQSYNFVETVGVGSLVLPEMVTFNCTFVEQPVVGYGCVLESKFVAGDTLPGSTGGVFQWQTDVRGFYVGCYVYVVITGAGEPQLQHDFTFTGIAMKDLPEHLLDL